MSIFKSLLIPFFLSLLLFTSCIKEATEPIDQLAQVGIYGEWKRDIYEVNGISSLAVDCCVYIEFIADGDPNDLKGEFRSTDSFSETNGVFELNASKSIIYFTYDQKQLSYGFQMLDDYITFTYSENNAEINEHWRKVE